MAVDERNGTHIRGTIVTLLDDHIPGIEEAVMSFKITTFHLKLKVLNLTT